MPKQLITGRAGCGKTARINEILTGRLADPGEILYLVPHAMQVHELRRELVTAREPASLLGLDVVTFQDLAALCRTRRHDAALKPLNERAKRLVLRAVVEKLSLGFFKKHAKYPSFAGIVARFITRLKNHMVLADAFKKNARGRKNRELAVIYEAYEKEKRQRGLYDREDVLADLSTLLDEDGTLLADKTLLLVDGFATFTRRELAILRKLVSAIDDAYVTLCFDEKDSGVFEHIAPAYRALRDTGLFEEVRLEGSARTESRTLAHIEQNIFAANAAKRDAGSGFALIEASSPLDEVETVANEILHLQAGGMKLHEISLYFRRSEAYFGAVVEVFKRFGIPFEIQSALRVTSSKLAALLLDVLRSSVRGGTEQDLLRLLKSAFWRVPRDTVAALEIELFRRRGGLRKILEASEDEGAEQAKAFLDRVREVTVELKKCRTHKDAAGLIEKLAADFHKKLLEFYARRLKKAAKPPARLVDSVRFENSAYEKIVAIVRDVADAPESASFSVTRFYDFMVSAFEEETFDPHIPEHDSVKVNDVSEARISRCRACFVLGLLEKNFPALQREDAVMKSGEAPALALDTLDDRIARERYLFYIALTRPSERLYVSYPVTDAGGGEELVSYYVNELTRLFTPGSVGRPETPAAFSTVRELYTFIAAHKDTEPRAAALYEHLAQARPGDAAIFRDRTFARPRKLAKNAAGIMAGGIDHHSASGLNTFLRCPYKYFAEKICAIESPLEEKDIVLTIGSVLHDCLSGLYRDGGWERLAGRDEAARAAAVGREVGKLKPSALPRGFSAGRAAIFKESMKASLLNFIRFDLDLIQAHGITPRAFEQRFELTLPLDGGVKITAILDRVDEWDGAPFILDYKSGSIGARFPDTKNTLDIQLPLYWLVLQAAEGRAAGGVMFYSIAGREIKGFARGPNPYYEPKRDKKDLDELVREATAKIAGAVGDIGRGIIVTRPVKDECRRCDFRGLCRYREGVETDG